MKLSKFSTDVTVDDSIHLVYNTMSRQYYLYPTEQKESLWNFMRSPDKAVYSVEEANLIYELARKGILVDNNHNELTGLEYREKKANYQTNVFRITIYTTNACNFRCSYCTQEHVTKVLKNHVVDQIIDLIDVISSKVKRLEVNWFGGEPLLQYDKIRQIMTAAQNSCADNHCILSSFITTNGYLLTEEIAAEMKSLNINRLQITIDENRQTHDAHRFLANGNGTYDQILSNLLMVLRYGIAVTLRMNISHESYTSPPEILNEIPAQYRHLVSIGISNLFQEKEKQSAYSIYRQAIMMGYHYPYRQNNYAGCPTCGDNSIVIDTDGTILFCTNAQDNDEIVGELRDNGKICYKNKNSYEEKLMLSALDHEKCRNCIELPFCIGSCQYARAKGIMACTDARADALTLEDRAKLDYYCDIFKHQIEKGINHGR